MGKPFMLIGEKRYECRHGKDKNVTKKQKYREKRKVSTLVYYQCFQPGAQPSMTTTV